ncbi:MAG: PilZ domain-containing protein [Nitrospirae bacterium]|nr:PilZ domain-containing protein [Nitrospirota bacterium]
MDKRRHSRLNINLSAELIDGEKKYNGFIENFSNGGLCIRSAPHEKFENIGPGDKITVRFQANPKDILTMCYRIKWLSILETTPIGSICKMGVEYCTN